MKTLKKPFLTSFFILMIIGACKKSGTGGDAQINITVKHHEKLIPGASVYIKFGAKEFPGFNINEYDNHYFTGSSVEEYGKTKIGNLLKGDYYLYAVGFDSSIFEKVTGGIYVKLSKNNEQKTLDLPVTE